MKTLVITEKPSVGKDIASVLGRFESKDGYLENEKYIVSWAFGHLVELADPSVYDPVFKKWDLATLPIIPDSFKLVEIAGSSAKQLRTLKKLLNSAEVSQVVNGCDAGREGESIFRRIYHFCGCRKPIKRLWLSETTPAAVKAAFKALREGQEYNNLAAAAEARGQADWLVGLNGTRAFTVRHGTVLSVGRVQTPTLNLIVSREREINNFVPVPYWEVWGTFQTDNGMYKGKWFREKEDRLPNREAALNLTTKLSSEAKGQVISLEQKEAKELPSFLFNLNDLQKEGNRRYGFTAQQVLDIAQSLYEKHKLLTYPRTDSRHLSNAMISTLPERLATLKNAPKYAELIPDTLPGLSKRYVDDGKITDHHAIIPTAVDPSKAQLSDQEKKIYDLVVRRFLSIFYPEARYAVTEVFTETAGELFKSRGRVELAAGWKMVWRGSDQETAEEGNGDDPEDQALPPLTQGKSVDVSKVEILEKQTKPPKRFTEATILAAMESAGKFVEDKEMAEVLKQTGGIGTPATRAAIIERLIKVGYVARDKKSLVPTAKGQILIDLVPKQLKSVELTASWEDGLRRVEEGQQNAALWIQDIQAYTRELVVLARNQEVSQGVGTARDTLGKCPVCGRDVVETAKSYGCSGYKEGCKFAIWKEINSKKISAKQAETLLTKGKTGLIKGFKSKAGKTFDALLVLGEDGKITFGFANAVNDQPGSTGNTALGKCPLCGKDVVENSRSYGCSGYKDGCKFVIWREIAKKKITQTQAIELLAKGKTGIIKGFKGQKGSFDAALTIINGEIKFAFAERM
ncbi:DNA topoisomerase III [Desulforamulus reducens MI-1]|uniref:DNA topoisomerase n=1 Tax=Desulforamulus reducens (strain ATCC BAA-1160 / DSM 100696 / MI-1) TaxID=349161 RepID=A4J356_DESRM|nr:DNA topoisomerase 3 [Desulforamulus reducens]ABO49509.1 DNA topoisomerase III [Desulforamulus reducens MI-1]